MNIRKDVHTVLDLNQSESFFLKCLLVIWDDEKYKAQKDIWSKDLVRFLEDLINRLPKE